MKLESTAADVVAPDTAVVEVPLGGRAMVVADLLLTAEADGSSSWATAELLGALAAWDGPGALVVAGDLLDLLATPDAGPGQILAAHPELSRAVAGFSAQAGRRVVCLPGARDGRLAWDQAAAGVVRAELGAEVALGAEVVLATGEGPRRVRIEPGQHLDPRFAVADPRDPADTPLGHHLLAEVVPAFSPTRRDPARPSAWLAGVDRLADHDALPRFVASRLAYRRVARHLWWLLIPFAVAVMAKVPLVYALPVVGRAHRHLSGWPLRLALVGITSVVDLALVGLGIAYLSRRAWASLSGAGRRPARQRGQPPPAPNDAARAEACTLVTAGWAGLVTGHTREPELAHLGTGFYANCGAAGEVVRECPGRLGLPGVFLRRRQVSWLELEAGAELHVRLFRSESSLAGASVAERLVARSPAPERLLRWPWAGTGSPGAGALGHIEPPGHSGSPGHSGPAMVASYPAGPSWPGPADPELGHRRVRRWAAAVVALAGGLDVISAVTPPLRDRLAFLSGLVPLLASETASAVVAVGGLALLGLARGIRRGQRQAWSVALALLAGTAVLNLVKGADLEEAVVALVVAAVLVGNRRSFGAKVDSASQGWGAVALVAGAVGTILATTAALEVSLSLDRDHGPLGVLRALQAVAGRLVGVRSVALPPRIDEFLAPTLLAVGLGLAGACAFLAFRPVTTRRRLAAAPARSRARDIVARHGQGTLDYFALRDDKSYFFDGDSLVAYGVYGGVCLVSPDPIGPAPERQRVWAAFRRYADTRGWTVAVLGASEGWLAAYRSSGMHDMYVGDEAVVEVDRFTLDGGRNKGLRQAVNRIARYGYTLSFHDPSSLDAELVAALGQVMTKSRRGEMERGFSMTLGRVFDPDDRGLLLAVARGADGVPVAFCQYVPAPGIGGYSLDLMRRDDGEHPNGLLDFVVVRTIEHLRQQGMHGLGLNFATMRAVLAGESGDGLAQRAERWVLRRMSGSMQIESLWRFNAKYDPTWLARFAVYDAPEHAVAVAVAIARAESFWELPVIGRFLVPGEGRGTRAS